MWRPPRQRSSGWRRAKSYEHLRASVAPAVPSRANISAAVAPIAAEVRAASHDTPAAAGDAAAGAARHAGSISRTAAQDQQHTEQAVIRTAFLPALDVVVDDTRDQASVLRDEV